jgi:hypothetical protein
MVANVDGSKDLLFRGFFPHGPNRFHHGPTHRHILWTAKDPAALFTHNQDRSERGPKTMSNHRLSSEISDGHWAFIAFLYARCELDLMLKTVYHLTGCSDRRQRCVKQVLSIGHTNGADRRLFGKTVIVLHQRDRRKGAIVCMGLNDGRVYRFSPWVG